MANSEKFKSWLKMQNRLYELGCAQEEAYVKAKIKESERLHSWKWFLPDFIYFWLYPKKN